MDKPVNVLVVDDEEPIRRNFRVFLEDVGYQVRVASNGREGLECFERETFDIVLTDLRMEEMSGLELISILREKSPMTPVVVVSGTGTLRDAIDAIRHGAWDYMIKPVLDAGELDVIIRRNLERARLLADNRRHQEHLEELVRERTRELYESEQKYRVVADFTYDWEYCIAPDGQFIYVSPSCERITGYSPNEFLQNPALLLSLVVPDDKEAVARHMSRFGEAEDRLCEMEFRIANRNGDEHWIAHSCRCVFGSEGQYSGRRGSNRDITERKREERERAVLEEQFRQAQKMESIGRLAGGIAHDFNNLLSVILGYLDMSMDELREPDPLLRKLREAHLAVERATVLTKRLLTFSRKQAIDTVVLNPNTTVRELEGMPGRLLGEDIDLRYNLAERIGKIEADRGQIEQILVNLAVNARDAMPDGGSIEIATANETLDDQYCKTHPQSMPGEYVALTVRDSGQGISKEVLDHIFEPFFTTKPEGKGTGLGLATVYGIVKQAGGSIEVHSEPGRGTTFKTYLPRVNDAPETAIPTPPSDTMPKGKETILLVEDDEPLRRYAEVVLKRLGYRVMACANAGEALLLSNECPEEIHLLLTDVIMPGMNGRALADALLLLRPGLRIMFVSGYPGDVTKTPGSPDRDFFFLSKPFTVKKLAQKVRETLDAAPLEEPA